MSARTDRNVDGDVFALLDHAFDGWGSREYFDWRYEDFPTFDPQEHLFTISDGGSVIASRRLFEREIRSPDGERFVVHVHGGAAVHRDHRGNGYYTDLLEQSMEYSRTHADYVCTFNREGKITTEHHKKNGWEYMTLPVYTKPLSPSMIAEHYLFDSELVRSVLRQTATVDRKITRSDFVSRVIAETAGVIFGGSGPRPPDVVNNSSNFVISRIDDPDETTVREVTEHIAAQCTDHHHFDRDVATVSHSFGYPGATGYIARDPEDGSIRAVLIAGYLEKSGFTECRVLEQTWTDPTAAKHLFEHLERDARTSGADVLVACSEYRPSAAWIPMGTEYMMWRSVGSGTELPASETDWRLTAYDVL